MTIDVDKLDFYSGYPIDKVIDTGTIVIINDGNSGDYQLAKIVTESIPNPYGKAVFIRAVYSINGTNFSPTQSHALYTFIDSGVATLQGLQAAVSVGVSDSNIVFRTANGYHGNVPVPPAFTPISQIFTIKYAIYEKE